MVPVLIKLVQFLSSFRFIEKDSYRDRPPPRKDLKCTGALPPLNRLKLRSIQVNQSEASVCAAAKSDHERLRRKRGKKVAFVKHVQKCEYT